MVLMYLVWDILSVPHQRVHVALYLEYKDNDIKN